MKSQLTVYKASAGSGKTFTLAKEYMTLVIDNPMSYRTILAVTFTNKATEEMKTRILSQLYGISHQLPTSADYLQQIHKALPHLSESQIIKNAGEALSLLLHNYNYFRVETIDTFFQSVLRNLARELDLTANLRIELNDAQVESQAVNELIESLQATDKLLFWIMDYIKENIADDKNWNVIGQIKSFGNHIFKDYYKDNSERLNECLERKDFFTTFTKKMKAMGKEALEHLQQIAETFFDSLEENGLTVKDFSNGSRGICGYFIKLRNKKFDDADLVNTTLAKCLDQPESWVTKAAAKPGTPAYDLVCSELFQLLHYAEENRPKLVRIYKSTQLTIKHMNQLRLLSSIDKKVREMNDEANRFLLSDTQTLLHSLIKESDSPFIFEKIGTQLEHVMIDEFQDTSTIQWKNFKVLLEETMSREDAGNLIVGDVKQSIYRWRSGDWRLLNNIEDEFKETHHTLDIKNLDTNYRSNRNVIEFNNAFFTTAAEKEYETLAEDTSEAIQLKNAYADVVQQVPTSKLPQGLVRITLLSSGKDDESELSPDERMMEMILDNIKELTSQGIPTKKIAILVRNKKPIQKIADYLQNNSNYQLVSDEAFRLDASQAVNILVTTLYSLTHPEDEIAKATINKFASKFLEKENMAQELEAQREELLQKPLFDLTEHLFHLYHLSEIEQMKEQSAYICAFYDQMTSYLADNSSDINGFLEEWDDNIRNKSIHSDAIDGIRLITIHKSKGLEFDNVIVPFCDWKMEQSDAIWCTPTEEPYNELPLVPVDFSAKQMKNSIYESDYYHEHLQNMVDNLNLLYVAFTRAGKNLFILGKRCNTNNRSHIIEQSLPDVANKLQASGQPVSLEGDGTKQKEADILFEFGELDTQQKKKEEKNDNVFTASSENFNIEIAVDPTLPEFRQSNKSRDFIQGDEEEEQQKYYIKMGTVLHALFSTIQTKADIEKALSQLELDGILYDENVSKERIEKMLKKRLESDQVRDWFSDKWTVFNECSILSVEDGKMVEHRPDRVIKNDHELKVIDFKFGKPKEEYHTQVRQYMELLSGMGYSNVKGYLWYVYPNKIEEVEQLS